MLHRKASNGLKMTESYFTITHKPFPLCSFCLYSVLFSMVLFFFPSLIGPLTAADRVINCLFCNKIPLNQALLFEYFIPTMVWIIPTNSNSWALWAKWRCRWNRFQHTSFSNTSVLIRVFLEMVGAVLQSCSLVRGQDWSYYCQEVAWLSDEISVSSHWPV